MRASYQHEMDSAESGLSLLASAGSVSPYVGHDCKAAHAVKMTVQRTHLGHWRDLNTAAMA